MISNTCFRYNEQEFGNKNDCIPLQIQLLFGKLQMQNEKSYVDTKDLIKSFQWEANDAFTQHDVQVII